LWCQFGLARSGGSLDPAAFEFPAIDVLAVPNYDDAAVGATGPLTQSFSNLNKQGAALPQRAPVTRHFRDHELAFCAQISGT